MKTRKAHYQFASGWELSYWSDPRDEGDVSSPLRTPEDLHRDPQLFGEDVALFIARDRLTHFDVRPIVREDED